MGVGQNTGFLVGITGGIGAGKTAVLEILARRGAPVMDADDVVHRLYSDNTELLRRLAARSGQDVLDADGCLDRRVVAQRVFHDPNELEWLNHTVHPLVREEIRRFAHHARGICFCGVPLLYEVGWQEDFRRIVAVWCDPDAQQRRLRQRVGPREEIQRRLAAQLPMDEKLERADYGIINIGPKSLLETQCTLLAERLYAEYTARSN